MFSTINNFSSQYLAFLAVKTSLQIKSRKNQVCEVRLIPALKLFCFREMSQCSCLLFLLCLFWYPVVPEFSSMNPALKYYEN